MTKHYRGIYGWAHAIIHDQLNYGRGPGDVLLKTTECVPYFWDKAKVGDSPSVGSSSVNKVGDPYVVWIVDCAKVYAITGRGHEDGYTYHYRAKSGNFGGSGHMDTLEEALERYDNIRGAKPQNLSLF